MQPIISLQVQPSLSRSGSSGDSSHLQDYYLVTTQEHGRFPVFYPTPSEPEDCQKPSSSKYSQQTNVTTVCRYSEHKILDEAINNSVIADEKSKILVCQDSSQRLNTEPSSSFISTSQQHKEN